MNYINDILNKKCISKQITDNTDFLLDKELDLKSRGLLITLICLEEIPNLSMTMLNELLPNRKDSNRSTMNNPIMNDYVKINDKRNEKGKFAYKVYATILKENLKIDIL